ncbi:MAG: oligosaccharide flippase family protein [Zestosphaera sp.]
MGVRRIRNILKELQGIYLRSDELSEEFEKVLVRTSRDAFVVFVGNFLSTLFLAVSAIIVARLLQPENYGIYSVSLLVSSVLLLFTDFGIDSALVKYVSKFNALRKEEIVKEVVFKGLVLKLFVVSVVSVVNYLFAFELSTTLAERPELAYYVSLTSILTFSTALMNSFLAIMTALGRMKLRSFVMIMQSLTKLLLSPLLVLLGFGVLGALLGHIASYVVSCVAGFVVMLGYVKLKKPRENIVRSYDLVRFGLPLYLSGLLSVVLQRFQYVMLARIATNAELGNMQAANQFISLITLTIAPFSITLFPVFSSLEVRGAWREINELLNNVLKYMSIFTVQVALMIGVFSQDVIRLIYGRLYVTAPLYLTLMSVGYVYAPFTVTLSALLSGLGRTKDLLYSSAIQLLIMMPVSYLLISSAGPEGYAIALSLTGLPVLTYLLLVSRELNVSVSWRSLTKIYVISLLSVLIATPTQHLVENYIIRLFTELLISIITYITLLVFANSISWRDYEILKKTFGGIPLFGKVLSAFLEVGRLLLQVRDKYLGRVTSSNEGSS